MIEIKLTEEQAKIVSTLLSLEAATFEEEDLGLNEEYKEQVRALKSFFEEVFE